MRRPAGRPARSKQRTSTSRDPDGAWARCVYSRTAT
jgi:hypothetical protein